MKKSAVILCILGLMYACNSPQKEEPAEWIQLFNGQDLSGWTVKIKGYPAGEDPLHTFRVEDGIMKVSYDNYGETFNHRFGHIFTEKKYSDYKLRVEYRFLGEQLPDGPEWAYRNSVLCFIPSPPNPCN